MHYVHNMYKMSPDILTPSITFVGVRDDRMRAVDETTVDASGDIGVFRRAGVLFEY